MWYIYGTGGIFGRISERVGVPSLLSLSILWSPPSAPSLVLFLYHPCRSSAQILRHPIVTRARGGIFQQVLKWRITSLPCASCERLLVTQRSFHYKSGSWKAMTGKHLWDVAGDGDAATVSTLLSAQGVQSLIKFHDARGYTPFYIIAAEKGHASVTESVLQLAVILILVW